MKKIKDPVSVFSHLIGMIFSIAGIFYNPLEILKAKAVTRWKNTSVKREFSPVPGQCLP